MEAEVHARRDAETLEVFAWALSRAGRLPQAREVMREALRSGLRDARLYYRSGLIEQGLGDSRAAMAFFAAAHLVDPTFDERARRIMGLGNVSVQE